MTVSTEHPLTATFKALTLEGATGTGYAITEGKKSQRHAMNWMRGSAEV
jgi:hypothetical protein